MGLGIKIPRNALAKAAKDYKENPNGDNIELEPGTYLAVITGLKGVETTKGPQIIAECKIGGDVDDKVKGGKVAMWFSFDEDRVIHLLRFLGKLGYEVDELDAKRLDEIAEEVKEAQHVIRLKATQKDDYVNVRMNKVMTDMTAEEVLAGEGSAAEEEEEEEKPKKSKTKAKAEPEEEAEEEEEEKPSKKTKKPAKEEEEEEAEEEEEKPKAKSKPKKEEEPEEEVEEEKDTVVKVGMKVKFKIKGDLHKGSIVSIDSEEGKVVVKSATDDKKYRLSPDKLED